VNKFNVPPGWPAAEPGWIPPEGWTPDPSWPPAPDGWQFWTIEADPSPVPPSSAQTITVPSPALPAKRRQWLAPTLTGIAGLVLGIIIGSAVGSGSSTSGAAPAAGGGQATSVTTPKLVPSSTPTPAPVAPLFLPFGQQWPYTDKLVVAVIPKGVSKASQYAAGAEKSGGEIYLFEVQIINGTKAAFDPAITQGSVTYGTGGLQAGRVFDSAKNLADSFTGMILPGQQQTVVEAYAVPAAEIGNVTMTFTPDFSHAPAIFSGPLS